MGSGVPSVGPVVTLPVSVGVCVLSVVVSAVVVVFVPRSGGNPIVKPRPGSVVVVCLAFALVVVAVAVVEW